MANVFVSHAGTDRHHAHTVAEHLRKQSHTVFLDFSLPSGVAGGLEWEKVILSAMRKSDLVVVCCTPAAMLSHWCFGEVLIARYEGKRVIPLLLSGNSDNVWDFLKATVQYIDFTDAPDRGYDRLAEAMRVPGDGLPAQGAPLADHLTQPSRPPYAGLRPLQPEDHSVFFARREDVEQLVALLRPRPGSVRRHFLTVIGASGSGKSSLVRAGLVPRILDGALPGSKDWLYVALTPGADPYRNLAEGLKRAVPKLGTVREIEDGLRDGKGGIDYVLSDVHTLLTEESHVLLFIDQLEEIVTRPRDPAEVASFLEALLFAAKDGPHDESRMTVISTARSDFYASLLEIPTVGPILVANPYPLGPLSLSRLREVIEGPARVAHIRFEDGLVDRILNDTGTADALPLLSFVLRLMYDAMDPIHRTFTHRAYDEVGTLQGALGQQAERAYADLPGESGAALITDILQHLVVITEDGKAARRRALRSDLSRLAGPAIDTFVNARLLVASDEGGVPTMEVAHEAIFRHWERLATAIARDTTTIQYVRQILQQALVDWERLRILLGKEQRTLINSIRDALSLDALQLELLVRSSLRAEDDVDYWLERLVRDQSTPPPLLESVLTDGDPASRHHLLDYIERSIDVHPELSSLLPPLSTSEYPALRRQTQRLIGRHGTDPLEATSLTIPFVPIPGGPCVVGPAEEGVSVDVAGFDISRFPITNLDYKYFVDRTSSPHPAHWTGVGLSGRADHPVVYVSFDNARDYCQWLSDLTGRHHRLPSEIEWEKAAGWDPHTQSKRAFPWGDEFDASRCNVWESQAGGTTPIGQYSPHGGDSAFGVSDMAGNVWEWTSTIGRFSSGEPPLYPSASWDNRDDLRSWAPRVQKGGTFLAGPKFAVTSFRLINLPELALQDFGFRVVRDWLVGEDPLR